jgi:hypothetical protein
MESIERDLGELHARMGAVETDMREMRADVREIRDAVTGFRGGWKALTLLMGVAASVGALAAKIAPYISMPKG